MLITHWLTNENVLVVQTHPFVPTLVSVDKIRHVACIAVLLLVRMNFATKAIKSWVTFTFECCISMGAETILGINTTVLNIDKRHAHINMNHNIFVQLIIDKNHSQIFLSIESLS